MDERNAAYMTSQELKPLAILPVMLFYSVTRKGLRPSQVNKIQLLRVLEAHASPEGELNAYITDFLKVNLHKLFAEQFGDVDHPNFDKLDHDLVEASDLLILKCTEQPAFKVYQRFLRDFALQVAMHPLCDGEITDEAYRAMRVQAQVVCGMLG